MLDNFCKSRTHFSKWKCGKELRVNKHSSRRMESADQILARWGVQGGFSPDRGVDHGDQGGGYLDYLDSTHEGRGDEARELAPAHRYAVITDSNVGPLYAEKVRKQLEKDSADVLTIPAGESSKTRESWARLTDRMLEKRYGRDSAVIALGGGVVGDLAGFVAATFMRGIQVVQIPTTLVAMV